MQQQHKYVIAILFFLFLFSESGCRFIQCAVLPRTTHEMSLKVKLGEIRKVFLLYDYIQDTRLPVFLYIFPSSFVEITNFSLVTDFH